MSDTPDAVSDVLDSQNEPILLSESTSSGSIGKGYDIEPYNPQRQYDFVRTVVTVGLLALLAFVIVWVAIKSAASEDIWKRTKDMLQIVLPALTALIGSALGFYFGTQKSNPPGA